MSGMAALTIPTPAEIHRRIIDCEAELKALRRLLRMSLATQQVADAYERRAMADQAKEAAHAS
jgi:hypothetical protein